METSWNKIFIFNLISVSYNNPGIDLPISIFSIFMLLDVYFFLLVNLFLDIFVFILLKYQWKNNKIKKPGHNVAHTWLTLLEDLIWSCNATSLTLGAV